MCGAKYLVVLVLSFLHFTSGQNVEMLKKLKECLARDGSLVCLKERALDALNETIMSDKPINMFGLIDIVKDPAFVPNNTEKFLPRDINQRSLMLNDVIQDKVEEFFESRSLKVNLGSLFEGRGKKDKKGGYMMMGGMALAAIMTQLFMGKIAMMAGAALLVSKLALILATIIGIKKLGGSSGGESSHVVFASAADNHGGGWHRSIVGDETNKNNPYRGHLQNEVVDNYTY